MRQIFTPVEPEIFVERLRWLGAKFIELDAKDDDRLRVLDFHKSKMELIRDNEASFIVKGQAGCYAVWGAVIFLGDQEDTMWLDGAVAIAQYLGFRTWQFYTAWARWYEEVWGNIYGDLMFSTDGVAAFGIEYVQDCTLTRLGEFHLGLANRVEELRQKNLANIGW